MSDDLRMVGSLTVSCLGLGVGSVTQANVAQAKRVIAAAIDHGITYFDISNRPESTERLVAAVLRDHRDNITLATKFGSRPREGVMADASARNVRSSTERSLRNMGTDRIDLLYLHRPDPAVPIAETLGALGELVSAGKIREIGCSKFSAVELHEADEAAGSGRRFSAVQNHLSLLHASDITTVLPLCDDLGIAYIAYWPLAAGLLTGKYLRGEGPPPDSRFARDEKWRARSEEWLCDRNYALTASLERWAADRGHSLMELAFGWLLGHSAVSCVVAGARSAVQIEENAKGASAWTLTPAEMVEVTELVADQQ